MNSTTTARTTRRRTLYVASAALTAAAALTLAVCSGANAAEAKPAGHTKSNSVAAGGWSGLQLTSAKTASPVRTQRLADGVSTAEITKLGEQHYRAKIVARGEVLATLETNGHDDGLDANDMFVTLTLDGQVHSWMGGGHQGPGTFTLAGGWQAKVTKLGEQHYRAKIVARGEVRATLETNGHDDGLDANDMFVTLTLDGQVHSWMGGGHQGPGTFTLAGGWQAKVTKLGELRYRAQIIGHDGVAATLETHQHDVGLDANGIYIVLSSGGIISAHA
ncbi:hypothetical protein [Streptomyces kronopolitis]|uniref:hypothetical protein n=1 Tax=Streptomyces kronopolitis TaxID=1612435 RepID=UPI0035576FE3